MKSTPVTRVLAFCVLGLLALLGVWLTGFFIAAPYHYVGVLFPLVLVYALGWLASRKKPSS